MLKGTSQNSLVLTGAQTASVNSSSVQVGNYNGLVAYLNCSAVSGSSPSAAIKLQDSPDGVTWYDIPSATFTAVTAAVQQRLVVSNVGSNVRAVVTITGTTPSLTFDLTVAGLN